jgi:2-polyprenyl-3-methyl-5-hydroxy-6-metoxy-1,4-benzoquinol methylase
MTMTGLLRTSGYDNYAAEYAAYVAWREQTEPEGDRFGLMPHLLGVLGEVAGQDVLDAGCGEGYLSRILADRGARVTGVDLAPRLVELGREKDPDRRISYRVADLSEPYPELEGRFDAVASYLVLNDVEEHRGFAATLARALRPGGRAVLAFNNPYDYVRRKGMAGSYFASGTAGPVGLSSVGVHVSFYHRSLAEYVDAFLAAGLQLTKIVDVDHPSVAALRVPGQEMPAGEELPRFMVLAFAKPSRAG